MMRTAVMGVLAVLALGLWSDVSDLVVGGKTAPVVTAENVPDGGSGKRKVRADEQATIQSTPESVIVINALKRATQQGTEYSAEVTGTANAIYVRAECTFNDTTQASTNRVDLKIEMFDPTLSEWVVIASGARADASPGENFALGTVHPTDFKGSRKFRVSISAVVQITSGINIAIYDEIPEPE